MTIAEYIIIILNVATLIAVLVSKNNRTPRPPAVHACVNDAAGQCYHSSLYPL